MTKVKAHNRSPRRLARLVLFSLLTVLVLGLLGGAYADWQWHRTVLTVVNQGGGPVDAVEVSLGRGPGRYALGRLQDGETKSVQVFPGGEDDMTLRLLDSKRRQVKWHGGYIEGTGGYRPRLMIGKNEAVRGETGLYSP